MNKLLNISVSICRSFSFLLHKAKKLAYFSIGEKFNDGTELVLWHEELSWLHARYSLLRPTLNWFFFQRSDPMISLKHVSCTLFAIILYPYSLTGLLFKKCRLDSSLGWTTPCIVGTIKKSLNICYVKRFLFCLN